MASDSHTLSEIKDFVFKYPPSTDGGREIFQQLFILVHRGNDIPLF